MAELTKGELAALYRKAAPGRRFLGDPPEKWDRATLTDMLRRLAAEPDGDGDGRAPEAVVVDAAFGGVWERGADGRLFTMATARAFAGARNIDRAPDHQTYRVYALSRVS